MKTAIELIADERKRQIEVEGFTPEHDDKHGCGELSDAAICYMMRGYYRNRDWFKAFWPWLKQWWKPTPDDRIRELVKACALGVAEIERLQRIEQSKEETFVCSDCGKVTPELERSWEPFESMCQDCAPF